MADDLKDFRSLAAMIVDRVDPLLQKAVDAPVEPHAADCSRCPICAAQALSRGENHELVKSLATVGSQLLDVLREFAGMDPVERTAAAPDEEPETPEPEGRHAKFEHIKVDI